MKLKYLFLLILPLFFSCNSTSKSNSEEIRNVVFEPRDKEILKEILELFADEKESPISSLMIKTGSFFLETPYVAHTLETETEQLVVNLRELDCTTFAENCLAISKTIKSGNNTFEQFAEELQNIRYHNGKVDGYESRIHYFSDWIYTNEQKKLVNNVSKKIAEIPYKLNVGFMSTHPDSYNQLKGNSQLTEKIAAQEKEINTREMFFIPEDKIADLEDKLMDGDIAGITTNIDGLDISHVVLLIRKDGRIHILHASSAAEKVVISENTLEDYLLNSKSATGIMVARPL